MTDTDVVVLSRFRVANGREGDVRSAFLNRPHLVDDAPGFIGLETFVDEHDASVFYLLTRWSDLQSFQAWHHSAAHRDSHRHIPAGLRLDAAFTSVWHMKKLCD